MQALAFVNLVATHTALDSALLERVVSHSQRPTEFAFQIMEQALQVPHVLQQPSTWPVTF